MSGTNASWVALALLLSACGEAEGDAADGSADGSESTIASASATSSPQPDSSASDPVSTTGSDPTGTDPDGTTAGDSTGSGPVGDGGCADDGGPALTDLERTIAELPADTWWAAPDTPMRSVCPRDLEPSHCTSVVSAWSGGAWDPVHRQLLVFGGGHADSPDNTLYAFELGTLSWTGLTEHSSPDLTNADPLPDGQPVSRHSYDGLQYIAHAERFFAWGGSWWIDGGGTGVTWTYEHGGGWTNMLVTPAAPAGAYSAASAYDPESGAVIVHVTGSLQRYSIDDGGWSLVADYGFPPYWPRYEISGDKRGLVDTSRGLFWAFGSGLYLVYDIAADMHVTDDWITEGGGTFDNADVVGDDPEQHITTGGAEIIMAPSPGVDYDAAADAIVGWVGGAPWRLDLATKTWTQGSAEGAPADVPNSGGTFGRWRYISRVNAFVLVNDVDDDVRFYKHTGGCG